MTDRISPNLASAHLQVSQEGAPQVEPYEMPLLYPAILIILYWNTKMRKLFFVLIIVYNPFRISNKKNKNKREGKIYKRSFEIFRN